MFYWTAAATTQKTTSSLFPWELLYKLIMCTISVQKQASLSPARSSGSLVVCQFHHSVAECHALWICLCRPWTRLKSQADLHPTGALPSLLLSPKFAFSAGQTESFWRSAPRPLTPLTPKVGSEPLCIHQVHQINSSVVHRVPVVNRPYCFLSSLQ